MTRIFGSPPRAWGQQETVYALFREWRFTPTCVGTTATSSINSLSESVHPHVRGDNFLEQGSIYSNCGSPPRAWGQPVSRGSGREIPRFTPTCVGTTDAGFLAATSNSVHPHVRGDNTDPIGVISTEPGSPPRAWGQRRCELKKVLPHRFTPTCVGTTFLR